MKLIKNNWYKLIFLSSSFLVPIVSFAQPFGTNPPDSNTQGKIVNPLGANGPDSIPAFIQKLLEGMLRIGIPVVALAIIYCGFLFVAARGNTEKLSKAKDALLYTLIGAAILLGSWAIAILISETVRAIN